MKKLTLPGSKSITNRDLILASLNNWKTKLSWILVSDDTRFMINALKDLGIEIEDNWKEVIINWWVEKLKWDEQEIYLGQSGTCMRFLPALACLIKKWKVTFSGEERLMERPMEALIDWIKQLWINIEARENKFPPIVINKNMLSTEGFSPLNNKIKMNWTISSQFFTALLNIWAFIKWWLEIEVIWDLVSKPYIDMTIFELSKFWIDVENNNYENFKILEKKVGVPLVGTQNMGVKNIKVEWDASALSYIANYIVLHWGRIEIQNLWKNTKQWDYKYLEILEKYFGLIYESNWEKTILRCGWIEKNIPLLTKEGLGVVKIDFEDMPDISMSFMSLAIFLPWKTKITWLKTLNLKECKRIDAMRDELRKLWVEVESDEESILIWEYNPHLTSPKGRGIKGLFWIWKIKIETYNDHRIAMTFGVLESYLKKKYSEKIKILNPSCVAKTYPNFWEDLETFWLIEDKLNIN